MRRKAIFSGLADLLVILLYPVLLAMIAQLAVNVFGRPRGANYSVTMHYLWIVLSLQGSAMVVAYRFFPVRIIFVASILMILGWSAFSFPSAGWAPFLSVSFTAIIFCALIFSWKRKRYQG
ncbi:MAG: hypothetical protein ACSHWS_13835 [Sulfitobacter sp.]